MKKPIALLIMFCALALGCANRYLKGYDVIHGRNFVFTKTFFYQKGANQQIIFNKLKSMEMQKVMRLLEYRYSITVDTSEFELFLYANNPSRIKASGLLSNTDFTWEAANTSQNKIEIECSIKDTNNAFYQEKDFKIFIYADGKRAATIYGNFLDEYPSMSEFAFSLGYAKENQLAESIYIDTLNRQQININAAQGVAAYKDPAVVAEKQYLQKTAELKAKIQEQAETLPVNQRARYRQEIIDYLNSTFNK